MKLAFEISRGGAGAETRASIEDPRVPVSAENFMSFFGMGSAGLPAVTVESALQVPAVASAVAFLSRTMASLPLHGYRKTDEGPERLTGKMAIVIHEAPCPDMGAFKFWQYVWQQVFTGGRGLAWIERAGSGVEALWPMEPSKVQIKRRNGRVIYEHDGKTYEASEVIDIAFMLKPDMLAHRGPITMATRAIQLALAMNEYASHFFAGGGVPPLALTGPMPKGSAEMQRAVSDVKRSIDAAQTSKTPIFQIPPGHELKPVGFDPEKGQMTDARRFQIEEVARAWQLPPVFLQDFTHGLKSSVEEQDLHLVKHLISQWAKAMEDELNLKLFGRMRNNRYVEYNLDGLMRGDFKSRIEGIVRGVQGGIMEPNRGRQLMNWPDHKDEAANGLFIQGATMPLSKAGDVAPAPPARPAPPDGGEDDPAGDDE